MATNKLQIKSILIMAVKEIANIHNDPSGASTNVTSNNSLSN